MEISHLSIFRCHTRVQLKKTIEIELREDLKWSYDCHFTSYHTERENMKTLKRTRNYQKTILLFFFWIFLFFIHCEGQEKMEITKYYEVIFLIREKGRRLERIIIIWMG